VSHVFLTSMLKLITFSFNTYRFPTHLESKWCEQLKLNASHLPHDAAVCSLHFSESMFGDSSFYQDVSGTIYRKLKSRAYPDINLPISVRVTETIRFDDATIVRILWAIRPHRCLWDPTFDAYWSIERRTEALQRLTQEMNYDEEPLLETIDEIRKVYVRQLAALESQPENPLFVGWFKEAQFIRNGVSNAEINACKDAVKIEPAVTLVTFPSTCRICLDRENADSSPFEELQSNTGLVEVFEKLTDFKIVFDRGDHLPAHICMSCKSWMMASHSFVDRCQRTEVVMQKMYQCSDANAAVDMLAELRANEMIEEVESESEESDEKPTEVSEPIIMEPEGLGPTIDWIIDRKYEVLENIWESFDQKAMNYELSNGSFEDQIEPGIPDLEGELLISEVG
jgi:Zinc-finger associated domain (zf-AD)/Alcohol dehydrogenase transcription factor Myb/SANT-like/THAP domain